MRVVGGILIVLITIVVYLRIRAGKKRDAKVAAAEAASATGKSATSETKVK